MSMSEEERRKIVVEAFGAAAEDLEDVVDYVCSLLGDDTLEAEEITEAIVPFLIDADVAETEEEAEKLGAEITEKLLGRKRPQERKLLDAPVNVGKLDSELDSAIQLGSKHLAPEEQITLVDAAALEAAKEKKRKQNEKKQRREERKKQEKLDKHGVERAVIFERKKGDSQGNKDLRLDNFTISNGGDVLIIDGSLACAFGRRYGLVGRNGSGKSTLLRHIAHREIVGVPTYLSILHVEQEADGDDVPVLQSVLNADTELIRLQKEQEDLLNNDPESLRLNYIFSRLEEIDAATAEARASAILSGLSFTPEMQQTPTMEFSGGWRMRVALARALFCKPDVLLLDEPTNHLDFHAVIWLEHFLSQWENTLIVVSHQREFMNSVCTDVLHLSQQRLTAYKGNYDAFEKVASEKVKQQAREFEAQQRQVTHIQKFIDRFRFNAKRASMAQSRIKKLEKMTMVSAVVEEGAVTIPFKNPEPLNPPILQFEDVSFGYEGQDPLFHDLNIGIDMDSRIALVGRNGSGKSTLLKLFSGELSPTKGHVLRNQKLRFATFSQHFVDQLDLDLSPLEYFQKLDPKLTNQEIRTHLGKYGITGNTALRSMHCLSGGQKSRVVFASMAAKSPPHILLLDEPSNHLDIETVEGLAQSLATFEGGLLVVSHDQRLIQLVCDEVWVVDGTVTKWKGDLDDYKNHLWSGMDF